MENLSNDISRTLFGVESTQVVLTEATTITSILRKHVSVDDHTDQVPSQASKGNLGSLPNLEPSSPLPEETFLAPLWDFPSTDLSGEVGRQPLDYDSHDESGGIGDL